MNKVIVVTGSSKGLGLEISKQLLEKGAQVFGCGKSSKESQAMLRFFPSNFDYLQVDLALEVSSKQLFDACMAKFGRIDGIVHNAAVLEPISRISDLKNFELCRLMQINVFSSIQLIQASLVELRKNKAVVVMISSGASVKAYAGWGSYCMSKASLNMLANTLAKEEPDITTFAVRPGVVRTEMQALIRDKGKEAMNEADYQKFTDLDRDAQLLPPEKPAAGICRLIMDPIPELNGAFVDWESIPL